MKKQILKSVSILIIGMMLLFNMEGKVDAKTETWENSDGTWLKGRKCIYTVGNTLYQSPFQPHSMGIRHKLASWKMNPSIETLEIAAVYGNTAYVSLYCDGGTSTLYSVNIKSRKKRKIMKNCCPVASKGKYIYGNSFKVSDTGAYPVSIWKITNNSVKRVKTIGKYIFGTTIVKNKVYYASYPNKMQKKMTVFRCNLDGSHRKKLFTLKGKGKYCQVLISDVNKKTITAQVSGTAAKTYIYTIKTGKLKKQKIVSSNL